MPGGRGQKCPRHHQVDRGITDAKQAEIEDAAELPVGGEQVGRMKVAVHPHWRAVPRRGSQRAAPGPDDGRTVRYVFQRLDGAGDEAIAAGQIAPELADRAAREINCPQGCDESGQPGRRRQQVDTGAIAGDLTRQPGRDAPPPGIALARHALAGHDRDGQRQPPGQHRKPPVLLAYLLSADKAPGQPDRQVRAQPVDHVVPASTGYGSYGQAGPVRELRRQQTPHQPRIDVHLGRRPAQP